ncbi:hypothetical protein SeMB42_g05491 [Synchytrium endobioticum]|uniref:Uncharacterized protein n=1 Tax=Synchytrium endobioticum TaxID=286115 RepID=A0A507CR46_9FUNG|nr:hypothetical protein SeMB42_g05491 [Synchytrium endobioticum]
MARSDSPQEDDDCDNDPPYSPPPPPPPHVLASTVRQQRRQARQGQLKAEAERRAQEEMLEALRLSMQHHVDASRIEATLPELSEPSSSSSPSPPSVTSKQQLDDPAADPSTRKKQKTKRVEFDSNVYVRYMSSPSSCVSSGLDSVDEWDSDDDEEPEIRRLPSFSSSSSGTATCTYGSQEDVGADIFDDGEPLDDVSHLDSSDSDQEIQVSKRKTANIPLNTTKARKKRIYSSPSTTNRKRRRPVIYANSESDTDTTASSDDSLGGETKCTYTRAQRRNTNIWDQAEDDSDNEDDWDWDNAMSIFEIESSTDDKADGNEEEYYIGDEDDAVGEVDDGDLEGEGNVNEDMDTSHLPVDIELRFPRSFELKVMLNIFEFLDAGAGTIRRTLSSWKKVYVTKTMMANGLCCPSVVTRLPEKANCFSPSSNISIPQRPTRRMQQARDFATADSQTKLVNGLPHYYLALPHEDRRIFDCPSSFPFPKAFITKDMRLGVLYRPGGLIESSQLQMTNLATFSTTSRKLGRLNGPTCDGLYLPQSRLLVTSPSAARDDDHEQIIIYEMNDGILDDKHHLPVASNSPFTRYPASVLAADEQTGLLAVSHDGWVYIWSGISSASTNSTDGFSTICAAGMSGASHSGSLACKTTIDVNRFVGQEEQIENLAIGGHYLAVATVASNYILVFDVFTSQLLHKFEECCHAISSKSNKPIKWSRNCTCLLLLKSPFLFASQNCEECKIQVWDLHTGHYIYTMKPYPRILNAYITSISLSDDGITLAVGLSNGDIVLYDFWPVKIQRSVATIEKEVDSSLSSFCSSGSSSHDVFPFSVMYREIEEDEAGNRKEVEGIYLF